MLSKISFYETFKPTERVVMLIINYYFQELEELGYHDFAFGIYVHA